MIYTDTIIRETIKEKRAMTNEEAINIIKGLPIVRYSEIKNTSCDINDALKLAIEALEKQNKYRWHDLRKNHEDLPHINKNVMFATIDGSVQEGEWNLTCWIQYRWTTHRNNDEVIAWREIEPFEVDS